MSAWLALLFLGEHGAPSIVIEPLGGEDLEILRSGDAVKDTSHVPVGVAMPGYIIQVKARRAGAWRRTEVNPILAGSKACPYRRHSARNSLRFHGSCDV